MGEPYADGYTENIDSFVFGTTAGTTTYDFEPDTPCTTICYADAATGNDAFGGDSPTAAKKTIQAAINAVQSGGEVHVLPGVYLEAAPGSVLSSIAGTYQFGLFFPAAKPGIKLIGVTVSDVAITSAGSVAATINTNATNNFGPSGIFVEGDNTTIQGIRIGTNLAGQNKTIEVIGDGFTIRNSEIADPEGSLYVNDFVATASTSHVKSYHVLGNVFGPGVSLDIASGAGIEGLVTDRVINGNSFNVNGATWNAISFSGATAAVAWFQYPVGGAIITNNTFAGASLQYIRARGTYNNAQFDWKSYWGNNTFDKATVVLQALPFTVRTYAYDVYTNVRRIGATIQGEVGNAVAGSDIVLAKKGTYREDVRLDKNGLTLLGAGMDLSTIIGPMTGAGTTLEIPASDVTVDGVTITREGNNTTDWTTTVKNQGVAIYGSGNTLQNSKITANRNGLFIYGGLNNTIKNNTIDFNRTGIHLVNAVSGLVVKNNFITNNWTIGVLFRDESSPNPTGTVTITDNNISGNWYSQVEGRSLFSAPALNVTGNWLGTIVPTVVLASTSSEPGYTSQIPVAFGGSAVPPSSAPTIVYNVGNHNNPVLYSPFLCTGVDASAAIGFQPSAAACIFGKFLSPLPKSTLAKSGSSIPVKFTVTGVTNGATLAANQQVRATLSGTGVSGPIRASAMCTWNAAGQNFQCNLSTPKGLLTGASNVYYITAQWTAIPFGAPASFVSVPGPANPEIVTFK